MWPDSKSWCSVQQHIFRSQQSLFEVTGPIYVIIFSESLDNILSKQSAVTMLLIFSLSYHFKALGISSLICRQTAAKVFAHSLESHEILHVPTSHSPLINDGWRGLLLSDHGRIIASIPKKGLFLMHKCLDIIVRSSLTFLIFNWILRSCLGDVIPTLAWSSLYLFGILFPESHTASNSMQVKMKKHPLVLNWDSLFFWRVHSS